MISKKDLLKEMNISYGQLYRWKREELIPEAWFMKLSVSSGQETFFERKLIIPRIKKILDLKDKYSLEELRDILNGTSNLNLYNLNTLINNKLFNKKILKDNLKGKADNINLNEVTILYFLSLIKEKYNAEINYDLDCFPLDNIKEMNILTLINTKNHYSLILSKDNIITDSKIVEKYLFHELKEKVVNILNGGL